MLSPTTTTCWSESNSASLHQTQGASNSSPTSATSTPKPNPRNDGCSTGHCSTASPSMTRTTPPSNRPKRSRRSSTPVPGHTTKEPCPAIMWGKVRTFNFTWTQGDSNPRPPACHAGALPAAPWARMRLHHPRGQLIQRTTSSRIRRNRRRRTGVSAGRWRSPDSPSRAVRARSTRAPRGGRRARSGRRSRTAPSGRRALPSRRSSLCPDSSSARSISSEIALTARSERPEAMRKMSASGMGSETSSATSSSAPSLSAAAAAVCSMSIDEGFTG